MDNIEINIRIERDRKVANIYLISGRYSFNKPFQNHQKYNIYQISH